MIVGTMGRGGGVNVVIELPIKTENPLNLRGNTKLAMVMRHRKYAKNRDDAFMMLNPQLLAMRPILVWPLVVTLTRLSSGHMDDDGIAASTKGVRDAVAKALGVDDGDRSRIRFLYDERKVKRGVYGVEVRIQSAVERRE
jgi:hypothetical protein